MKLLALCICILLFMPSDCNKANIGKTVAEQNASAAILDPSGKDEINNQNSNVLSQFKFRLIKKGTIYNKINYAEDTLYIDYELKNQSDRDYLVFNRGHAGKDDGKPVYVEPQADGSVELSQKAFVEPKDKRCPQRLINIVPRASLLKAKQSIKEQISLSLPLRLQTPYDDCAPQPVMPDKVDNARFCLGIVPVDAEKIKVDAQGNIQGWDDSNKQEFLCSDTIELK